MYFVDLKVFLLSERGRSAESMKSKVNIFAWKAHATHSKCFHSSGVSLSFSVFFGERRGLFAWFGNETRFSYLKSNDTFKIVCPIIQFDYY